MATTIKGTSKCPECGSEPYVTTDANFSLPAQTAEQ